jgi:hypothetical protein
LVSAPIGDGGIHVYEGMTTPTPRVRPAFAFFGGPPSGFGATIAGSLAGGALGAGEVVVACVEGLAIPAYGCDVLTSGDVDFSIGATWFDTATTSVRLHALHIAVDGDGVPTSYLGYDTDVLNLSDGVVTLTGLNFDPVASGTLFGTTSHPEGATNQGLIVMARFGPNLSMHFAQIQDPGPAFEVLVPVLPGLSYDVFFGAAVDSTSVNTWKLDAGLDAGTFDVAAPAQMVAPADGAIGVDLATTFSSTSDGGARTYAWAPAAGTQQRGRYDGDAVAAAVGVAAGGDDDGVEQVGAEALAEPVEVAHVVVGDGGGDLDLDGDDPAVVALDDEVDLVVAVAGSEVVDARLGSLGVGAHAERNERLEEAPREIAVAQGRGAGVAARQERVEADAEQSCSEGRIGQVMLGRQWPRAAAG